MKENIDGRKMVLLQLTYSAYLITYARMHGRCTFEPMYLIVSLSFLSLFCI